MIVAFAYAAAAPEAEPLYRTLAEGMIKNVKSVMPGFKVLHITDNATSMVKGSDFVLGVERTQPLMVWRLKAHEYAHSLDDEILFVEPDVRFVSSVMDIFDSDFDVALATRDCDADWGEAKLGEITPYTMGATASRSPEFWRAAKIYCQTLPERDQLWIGDMLAITHIVESEAFKVKIVPGEVYNHILNDPENLGEAKALHYKGTRKSWLLPQAVEA